MAHHRKASQLTIYERQEGVWGAQWWPESRMQLAHVMENLRSVEAILVVATSALQSTSQLVSLPCLEVLQDLLDDRSPSDDVEYLRSYTFVLLGDPVLAAGDRPNRLPNLITDVHCLIVTEEDSDFVYVYGSSDAIEKFAASVGIIDDSSYITRESYYHWGYSDYERFGRLHLPGNRGPFTANG